MMRRFLISLILAAAAIAARAVPAVPTPVRYRQPDGSVVEVQMHGDEFFHYCTLDGKTVALGRDGYWHPARRPSPAKAGLILRDARRRPPRPRMVARAAEPLSVGEKRFLVLLVEFKDLKFSVENPREAFSRMLNSEGYSDNGATGSVADYYKENSNGRFTPVFDVAGPVQVSGSFADYGANDDDGRDKNLSGMVEEACRLADATVDFSLYDLDTDGYADNVYIYFAGHNEAEGAGSDHIWPQAYVVKGDNLSLDGVHIWSFACSSELRGSNGAVMSGIGTFCHEFAHVLGLPDFYDTDYEENGSADAVYAFSLMCSGNYNNSGRTPPYMGAMERWLLGWTEAPAGLNASGSVSLGPVHDDESASTPCSRDGEFFLYEVRDGSGWDAYVLARSGQDPPAGMVIYHVDRSDPMLWEAGGLNNNASHPCYYIVKPVSSWGNYNDMLYPGTSGTSSFEGVDWSGNRTGFVLSSISYAASRATFELAVPGELRLCGTVTDSGGKPLQGVSVSGGGNSTGTLADGTYELSFSESGTYEVLYSLEMYRPRTETVRLQTACTTLDLQLLNITESEPVLLSKHGEYAGRSLGFTSGEDPRTGTIAVGFSAGELAEYQGYEFASLRFRIHGSKADRLSVFVDFGSARAFTREIPDPVFDAYNTVDISDAGLTIPAGQKIYVGCAVQGIDQDYWMCIDGNLAATGGGYLRQEYASEGSMAWYEAGYNFLIDCTVRKPVAPFAALGFKTLSNPSKGESYSAGTALSLSFDDPDVGEIPQSVEWFFDGEAVDASSVSLSSAGRHSIVARLSYADGSVEEIEQIVLVD